MKEFTTDQDVHDHIEEHFTEAFKADAAAGKLNICGIWEKVSPILKFIIKVPFIPRKWKDAAKIFIDAMDTACTVDPAPTVNTNA